MLKLFIKKLEEVEQKGPIRLPNILFNIETELISNDGIKNINMENVALGSREKRKIAIKKIRKVKKLEKDDESILKYSTIDFDSLFYVLFLRIINENPNITGRLIHIEISEEIKNSENEDLKLFYNEFNGYSVILNNNNNNLEYDINIMELNVVIDDYEIKTAEIGDIESSKIIFKSHIEINGEKYENRYERLLLPTEKKEGIEKETILFNFATLFYEDIKNKDGNIPNKFYLSITENNYQDKKKIFKIENDVDCKLYIEFSNDETNSILKSCIEWYKIEREKKNLIFTIRSKNDSYEKEGRDRFHAGVGEINFFRNSKNEIVVSDEVSGKQYSIEEFKKEINKYNTDIKEVLEKFIELTQYL